MDPELLGQIISGGATTVAAGLAAFFGVRGANRSTKVQDARAEDNAEWDRIRELIKMACSDNKTEAYVGMHMLREAKKDWNENSAQRLHIKRALDALNAQAIAAYHEGATQVQTTPPPGGTVNPP